MRTRFPSPFTRSLVTIALALGLSTLACGSGDTAEEGDRPTGDTDGDPPHGTVAVGLEEVDGFFIEGFEIGLRYETGDGTVVGSTLWSEAVAERGDDRIEAFYDTVVDQPVPAGDVVVLASVRLGVGPPPETPDLDGPMDCRLELTVPAGARVEVEVDFSGTADCLREVDRS